MNRFRRLSILMGIAILGITGFQAYWLRENYIREEKTLAIKTQVAFRETAMHLQVSKLKLNGIHGDSAKVQNIKVMVGSTVHEEELKFGTKENIVSTVNVIRDKLSDSAKKTALPGGKMIISMNTTSLKLKDDPEQADKDIPPDIHLLDLLYSVDSLQDSIKLSELNTAYANTLKQQHISIPFTIIRYDSSRADHAEHPAMDEIKLGFAKPVTYKLKTGNTFPYLLKKILLPFLFSILLLGITLLSFILLHRNMVRQQRLADLKNEFISNITHELKTPVATVGVAIEALKNFNALHDPVKTTEYLDISSNELQRLSLLIDKVLKLSMFEQKEVELKKETVNMEEVVNEVVNSLRLQTEKQQARITVKATGDTTLQADRLHLLSVVFNLLDNALKYSRENPEIEVSILGNANEVQLNIKDNGIGIAPEYKDKVFEKFFRIPHGDTHNAKGYGLGLSYVAQIIGKLGGNIRLESVPDTETVFHIVLPKHTA